MVLMRRHHILSGSMPNPLLVIDGPAVLYRSFYGLPDTITDDDGHPINALLGSVNQALWCVEKYDPRAVVWCFGAEAGEYRVEAFPSYHADRPPMPDPLEWQWERAPALYDALGWSLMATEDLEADDLLHSLCEVETAAGGTTLILTGDRDMYQCVSDTVKVLMQRKGGEGPEEVDEAGVVERYGIQPSQVPDFIALRGDPSDGLPGAKGIGPKTAAELLQRKGDLEHVILGAIREKPSVRRALIEQADELRAFKDIATLRTVPVDRPPDAPTDYEGGSRAAAALGMARLSKRLEELSSA
jgi:5'-3' exonuclease